MHSVFGTSSSSPISTSLSPAALPPAAIGIAGGALVAMGAMRASGYEAYLRNAPEGFEKNRARYVVATFGGALGAIAAPGIAGARQAYVTRLVGAPLTQQLQHVLGSGVKPVGLGMCGAMLGGAAGLACVGGIHGRHRGDPELPAVATGALIGATVTPFIYNYAKLAAASANPRMAILGAAPLTALAWLAAAWAGNRAYHHAKKQTA